MSAQGSVSPALDRGQKVFFEGGHRTRTLQQTLDWVTPMLARMGITRVADITGLDKLGLPVVMVTRPNSRSLAVAQGKGLTLAAAKVSAIMEAAETFHAERVSGPLRLASYAALREHHRVVNVSRMAKSREARFHTNLSVLWIEGRDLLADEATWLPYESVHTSYTVPRPTGSGCFPANTNGLASGNHPFEATTHAICEAIERDALSLWQQTSDAHRRATVLDPLTIDDAVCEALLERIDAAGVDVKLWDVTSDVGVACVYCLLVGRDEHSADPEFGSGCHPSRSVALARAITEAAQARTTFIAGSRDDYGAQAYAKHTRARRLEHCRRVMQAHRATVSFEDIPSKDLPTFEADVQWLLQRLRGVEIEQVLSVDLTRRELGVPVVRIVVPGLEGAYKGPESDYVPGPRAVRASALK